MAEQQEALRAVISASDEASPVFQRLGERMGALTREAHHADKAIAHVGRENHFETIAGHLTLLRGHFLNLRESIGESGKSFAEYLPMMAGLGAVASFAGLKEMVEHVSERQAEFGAFATQVGVTRAQLAALSYTAQMTDVPLDKMREGMMRLTRTMGDAAAGRNKEAAAIFARMGISLKDSHGHMKSLAEILPQVEDSLNRTTNTTTRGWAAMQLFGRSGAELLPMLTKDREEMERMNAEAKELVFVPDQEQFEDLEHFHQAWLKLGIAVNSLEDEIATDLAPVLTPVVDEFTHWVSANRAWIGEDMAGAVKELGDTMRQVPWHEFGEDMLAIGHGMNEVVAHTVGWDNALTLLLGLAIFKATSPLRALAKDLGEFTMKAGESAAMIGRTLVGAFHNVETAATEAKVAEEAALNVGKKDAAAAAVTAEAAGKGTLRKGRLLAAAAGTAALVAGGAELPEGTLTDAAIGGLIGYQLLGLPGAVGGALWNFPHPKWLDQTPGEALHNIYHSTDGLSPQEQINEAYAAAGMMPPVLAPTPMPTIEPGSAAFWNQGRGDGKMTIDLRVHTDGTATVTNVETSGGLVDSSVNLGMNPSQLPW